MLLDHKTLATLPKLQRRRIHTLAGTALLLGFLGGANILYGSIKHGEYSELLIQAEQQIKSEKSKAIRIHLLPQASLPQDDPHLKIRARVEFYELVVSGGKLLILLACLPALLIVLLYRLTVTSEDSTLNGNDQA